VVDSEATPGGGSLPTATIASAAIEIAGDHSTELRDHTTPIIARVHEGRTLLDLRTIDPADDAIITSALAASRLEGLA
ncbi:MAG: L-seryl-tRNA(Sec) selenium transferase, partial [Actinomycetia bacterium]|nr:L-seryl-tRNA(Sec) selenium transferase [Actinomycetes bacterium]